MEEDENFMLAFDVDIFEDEFHCWNQLPHELKIKILQYLSFGTLWNFMFFSKECFSMASCVRTRFYSIDLIDPDYGLPVFRKVVPKKRIDLHVNKRYLLSFSEDGKDGCLVTKATQKKGQLLSESVVGYHEQTYQSVALRTFFQLAKNARVKDVSIKMRSLTKEAKRLIEEQPHKISISCFSISANDGILALKLLRFVTPGCGLYIDIGSFRRPVDFCIDSSVFDSDVMKMAPFVHIGDNIAAGLTDEQILDLRADRIFMPAQHVSSQGIKGLVQQWFNGKRRIVSVMLIGRKDLELDVILEAVHPSFIISEEELYRRPLVGDRMREEDPVGFIAGIWNKFGSLIVITIGSNFCEIFDAYVPNPNTKPWS